MWQPAGGGALLGRHTGAEAGPRASSSVTRGYLRRSRKVWELRGAGRARAEAWGRARKRGVAVAAAARAEGLGGAPRADVVDDGLAGGGVDDGGAGDEGPRDVDELIALCGRRRGRGGESRRSAKQAGCLGRKGDRAGPRARLRAT